MVIYSFTFLDIVKEVVVIPTILVRTPYFSATLWPLDEAKKIKIQEAFSAVIEIHAVTALVVLTGVTKAPHDFSERNLIPSTSQGVYADRPVGILISTQTVLDIMMPEDVERRVEVTAAGFLFYDKIKDVEPSQCLLNTGTYKVWM
ncbi:hypothetical protein A2801_04435 [Candidatus Woesebacteria bacterium RIFCSPHIGHO2_01_FULL_41_10]|uniref:Uncharacterized protein n=1 Tax=Candidatus Woesebacteria bacterium RIFCSPHIGHO2_01_FULL_41_10 TaxID=1802500 RepID=A0A1F7YLS6_9BACT|nr:MAG: hypothetical protein A2801_04435 [Candidatus Woesebacteria bacterium RIFCSPHIGHO2_01_FULL_41_10]